MIFYANNLLISVILFCAVIIPFVSNYKIHRVVMHMEHESLVYHLLKTYQNLKERTSFGLSECKINPPLPFPLSRESVLESHTNDTILKNVKKCLQEVINRHSNFDNQVVVDILVIVHNNMTQEEQFSSIDYINITRLQTNLPVHLKLNFTYFDKFFGAVYAYNDLKPNYEITTSCTNLGECNSIFKNNPLYDGLVVIGDKSFEFLFKCISSSYIFCNRFSFESEKLLKNDISSYFYWSSQRLGYSSLNDGIIDAENLNKKNQKLINVTDGKSDIVFKKFYSNFTQIFENSLNKSSLYSIPGNVLNLLKNETLVKSSKQRILIINNYENSALKHPMSLQDLIYQLEKRCTNISRNDLDYCKKNIFLSTVLSKITPFSNYIYVPLPTKEKIVFKSHILSGYVQKNLKICVKTKQQILNENHDIFKDGEFEYSQDPYHGNNPTRTLLKVCLLLGLVTLLTILVIVNTTISIIKKILIKKKDKNSIKDL